MVWVAVMNEMENPVTKVFAALHHLVNSFPLTTLLVGLFVLRLGDRLDLMNLRDGTHRSGVVVRAHGGR